MPAERQAKACNPKIGKCREISTHTNFRYYFSDYRLKSIKTKTTQSSDERPGNPQQFVDALILLSGMRAIIGTCLSLIADSDGITVPFMDSNCDNPNSKVLNIVNKVRRQAQPYVRRTWHSATAAPPDPP
jgi:hypothetical protein